MPMPNLFVDQRSKTRHSHCTRVSQVLASATYIRRVCKMKSDPNGTVQQLLNLCVTEQKFSVSDSLSSNRLINVLLAPL